MGVLRTGDRVGQVHPGAEQIKILFYREPLFEESGYSKTTDQVMKNMPQDLTTF